MTDVALAVIAKRPLPGAVKTRLTPPLSPAQAAALASAALQDTLEAIAAVPGAGRRVLVIDRPGVTVPDGFELLLQRGGGLDERLANAFVDLGGPAVIVGMDTPQLTTDLLSEAVVALQHRDALLGPALDGGYWGIGLNRPDPAALLGVPMSTAWTGAFQRARLNALGLTTELLPALLDVDAWPDALAVAALAPTTRFAQQVAAATERAAA